MAGQGLGCGRGRGGYSAAAAGAHDDRDRADGDHGAGLAQMLHLVSLLLAAAVALLDGAEVRQSQDVASGSFERRPPPCSSMTRASRRMLLDRLRRTAPRPLGANHWLAPLITGGAEPLSTRSFSGSQDLIALTMTMASDRRHRADDFSQPGVDRCASSIRVGIRSARSTTPRGVRWPAADQIGRERAAPPNMTTMTRPAPQAFAPRAISTGADRAGREDHHDVAGRSEFDRVHLGQSRAFAR